MTTSSLTPNAFQLATIKIRVNDIAQTIYFMDHVLGFKYIRTEVDEYGMQAFLLSNGFDAEKSIQFCVRQEFYPSNDESLIFGLRPMRETYSYWLTALHDVGFNMKGFEKRLDGDEIRFRADLSEFVDLELNNFVVENISREEVLFSHLTELAHHYPLIDSYDDEYSFSEREYPSHCTSYLKEIQIKVDSIESYESIFKRLGFSISKIEYGFSGKRNIQVLMNKHCDISIRFIEATEKMQRVDINSQVSFVIATTTYNASKGGTFSDLNDIGYEFLNKVFDDNGNVIANHAELVDNDGVNWTILEM